MGNGIKLTVLLHLLDSLTISLELLSQLLQLVTLILTTLESTRNLRLSTPTYRNPSSAWPRFFASHAA